MSILPPPPPPAQVLAARPELPARSRGRRASRIVLVLLAVVLLVLAALVLAAGIAASTGLVGLLIGLGLALLPVVPLTRALVWVDRFEPEPAPLLTFLFVWGAVVAALVAAVINSVSVAMLRAQEGEQALATTAVFVAPVVEEVAKGLGIVVVVLVRRREFDGVVDGIVCAGFVALGFAFTENILYFGRAFLEGQTQLGVGGGIFAASATFVFRGVLSPFAHPMFTALTGIGLGLAVYARPPLRLLAPIAGLAGAIALHSWWNFTATRGLGNFVISYLLFMLPLFGLAVALVAWLRAREGRLIARRLPAYAATGWIPPYDVPMVASLAGRRQARAWARARLGKLGERAMDDYQRAAAELAFLRDRAERLGPDRHFAERERGLLAALVASRAALAPAVPGSWGRLAG